MTIYQFKFHTFMEVPDPEAGTSINIICKNMISVELELKALTRRNVFQCARHLAFLHASRRDANKIHKHGGRMPMSGPLTCALSYLF